IQGLPHLSCQGHRLSVQNSFQYGPICIDVSVRGSGILEGLFSLVKEEMAHRFTYLVTFINKNNPRSFAAHTRKLGLEVIQEFEFNSKQYYELACICEN